MKWILFLIALSLTGCRYHLAEKPLFTSDKTLSIPFVKGDVDGQMTSALVFAMANLGDFHYVASGGEYELEVTIIKDSSEQIGYQYDRKPKTGELITRLVPNEGRRDIIAQIKLYHISTGELLFGPEKISAFADYDFVDADSLDDLSFINSSGVRESTLEFSLGQLDSREGAKDASLPAVYTKLARRIAFAVDNLALHK